MEDKDYQQQRVKLRLVERPEPSVNPELEHLLYGTKSPADIIKRVLVDPEYFLSYIGTPDGRDGWVRNFSAPQVNDVLDAINATLHQRGSILLTGKLDIEKVRHHAMAMGINLAVDGVMLNTITPDLPRQNFERHLWELVAEVECAVVSVASTESLFTALYDAKLFSVDHEDTLRYLLYLINKDRLWPKVLVLPNEHHFYKPALVLHYDDISQLSSVYQPYMLTDGLPADIKRLFRIFDR